MEIVKCAQCGKEEQYDMKPGYPRKYCSACSAQRKADFEAKKATPQATPKVMTSNKDDIIVSQVILKETNNYVTAMLEGSAEVTMTDYREALMSVSTELENVYKKILQNMSK